MQGDHSDLAGFGLILVTGDITISCANVTLEGWKQLKWLVILLLAHQDKKWEQSISRNGYCMPEIMLLRV